MPPWRPFTTPSTAQTLGLKALAFLAADADAIHRFLGNSGLDATTLRQRAADSHTLAAVLEFLLANEALLAQFCGAEAIAPKDVHIASHRLGG